MAEEMFCYHHPDRQTLLRCNRCGKPICSECAERTPTGFRCKDCIREQQKVFDTAKGSDYPLAALAAAATAFLVGYIEMNLGYFPMVGFLPEWLLGILAAALAAGLIQIIIRKVLKGHRARKLDIVITAAAFLGALVSRYTMIVTLLTIGFIPQVLLLLVYPAALVAALRAGQGSLIIGR